jgi:hypothetical protein
VRSDRRTFWGSLGDALALPFGGSGSLWLLSIVGGVGAAVGVGTLASFLLLLAFAVALCAGSALLALACDYYRACFWAVAAGEPALGRGPDFAPARVLDVYLKQGLHLLAFGAIAHVPVIAWFTLSMLDGVQVVDLLLDPVTWVLFFLSHLYWPIGVGLTAFANDFAAIWRVLDGVRAIFRAPLPYLVIVTIGFGVFALTAVVLAALAALFGVTGALASAALGLPLALSHGIEGSLMGHLARTRASLFE